MFVRVPGPAKNIRKCDLVFDQDVLFLSYRSRAGSKARSGCNSCVSIKPDIGAVAVWNWLSLCHQFSGPSFHCFGQWIAHPLPRQGDLLELASRNHNITNSESWTQSKQQCIRRAFFLDPAHHSALRHHAHGNPARMADTELYDPDEGNGTPPWSILDSSGLESPSFSPPGGGMFGYGDDDDGRLAMAFSGGGIRSAAFCSGVLRKLVADGADISHMSCVSGGGYIGSSFAEWVTNVRARETRRSGQWPDIRRIADDYFQHLTTNFAIYCDWQENSRFPWRGLRDTIVFVCAALVTFILLPVLALMAFIPVIMRIDTLCGDAMRTAFAGQSAGELAASQDDQSHLQLILAMDSPVLVRSLLSTILGCGIMSFAQRFKCKHKLLYALGMWLGLQLAMFGGLVLVACLFEVLSRNATVQVTDRIMEGDHGFALYGCAALVIVYLMLIVIIPGSPIHQRVGHAVFILAGGRFLQWTVFTVPLDTSGESRQTFEQVIIQTSCVMFSMCVLGPLRFTIPFLYNR